MDQKTIQSLYLNVPKIVKPVALEKLPVSLNAFVLNFV